MALRAKLSFKRHIIFKILQSKILKMMCLLKEYSAAVGGKRLFTQPPPKYNLARSANKRLLQSPQIRRFAAKPQKPLINSFLKIT